ncbi:TonB-dependent receptor domain-containing protein [Oceanisphaera sp. W20_SRM_FM3]|uniref:TonB-dependent receptor domain-containing protein n=1 Tax=Oceanisphaera sp. W20_SRM_FM3 TaxID=3240267 RepID=UPI003F980C6D
MSKKLLVAVLLPWAAFAQNSFATPADDATEITIYSKVKQPLTSALAPVEVITKADIERRQPRSLVDLLETLPGMQFGTQSGGLGQATSLFVRGTESDHVLVLVNGRPQAQMVNNNFDFSRLPVSNVERIEYIRGPRAAIYGSSAIGGVVNIITSSPINDTKLSVTTGSNDYYAGDVSINQWVTDETRLQLATGYRETRGYDVKPQPGNTETDRDGFDSKNLTLGIEHKLNQAWTWGANANGWESKTDYDGSYSDTSATQSYQVDTGLSYQDEQLAGQLNASYGEFENENWVKKDGRNSKSYSNIANSITRLDGLVQNNYSEQGYTLVGMDWQQERQLSKSTGSVQSSRDNTGVFTSIYHTWSPLTLELTGRIDDNEQYGSKGTWQSALSLAMPAQHRTTLSYGTAFKAPSFGDIAYAKKGIELQPEESQNWELGFAGDYDVLDWQLNLYRNNIDNLIVYNGGYVNSTENTDSLIRGAEFIVKADTGLLHHTFSYDYTNAKDIKTAKQLIRRAKRKASWTGDVDVFNTNLFAQVLYVGERGDVGNVTLLSYTIWNIGARYPLTQQLTLNGKINNLFDKDYQVIDGYDAPDMEFYVGADYRF